jgi:hypothetical protein
VDFKLLIPEMLVEEPKLEECKTKALAIPKPSRKQQKNTVPHAPNNTTKESHQRAADNCKMQCDICSTVFHEWADVASHFKSKHQQKGYVLCICCNKRFYQKLRLLGHVEVRLNPDAFK